MENNNNNNNNQNKNNDDNNLSICIDIDDSNINKNVTTKSIEEIDNDNENNNIKNNTYITNTIKNCKRIRKFFNMEKNEIPIEFKLFKKDEIYNKFIKELNNIYEPIYIVLFPIVCVVMMDTLLESYIAAFNKELYGLDIPIVFSIKCVPSHDLYITFPSYLSDQETIGENENEGSTENTIVSLNTMSEVSTGGSEDNV
ncbi:hypothetical protein DICPUDRAFT_85559 [Dictyostelium purpureum]|uniref:Uncharacterized protein n=1 Tax=Dictyostelium purpureum TaxID=5786 RepID=F1A640_DICPU|nr:uncharacterized protein DICPUDRAFT_85559 [Dictyostelium purpureum]EGC28341.1 hypothetical protein DICPUDRAFT_85559 [Dictyostelium purpureum]|eukprot:XP_003295134.1 hypothetical protein DICPUDRAFT_85559 [Dictyostelium purpureum]